MNSLYPLMAKHEEHEEHEEQHPDLKLYIFPSTSQVAAASSHLAFATCFTSSATQHDHQRMDLHHHQNQGEKSIDGSRTDIDHQEQQLDEYQIKKGDNGSAAKYWMSSKMRLMQKMMKVGGGNSDQAAAAAVAAAGRRSNNNEGRSCCSSNGVRVCSDCNTTTTPLWRSGPQGPKSLCNACGIRQRKARRAMAEAANGGGGGAVVAAASGKELHKEKKSRLSWHGDDDDDEEVKKKKGNNRNMGEKCLESQSEGRNDGVLRLSKNGSAFGRVFPRDEEEAAILLMELSCGLVHTC
ncbi:GATA transcription factor 21-like [Cucurbita pepo subsp. pepo]|uniref:GATA transcription factor 21-like n=1 Tax=Cucurbita pepo subsp. pepo TaxID=3664 RepID=UPI000C9D75CB|nr:GATA transcription factor 21-like [Cucurbita pepo subsp. pepo]